MKTGLLSVFLAGLLIFPAFAQAVEMPESRDYVVGLTFENDLFSNTDRHYTNGVRLSLIPPDDKAPEFLQHIASLMPGDKTARIAYFAGQNMYTPRDTRLSNPAMNDRPYAGWLYGGATMITSDDNSMDALEISLGVVGPASLAEESQRFIHKVIGKRKSQGWDYQIENEPALLISYEHKWRGLGNFNIFGLEGDATPSAGFNLGNVFTQASIGGIVRIGADLPDDYGPPLIQPSISSPNFFEPAEDFSWYFFGGVTGRAVAQNIFLDGNTFTSSRDVDKEHFVGDLQLGAAITFNSTRIAYTHVFRTEEFKTQREQDSFGAVTVTIRF